MNWNQDKTHFIYKDRRFRAEWGKYACGWNLKKNIGRNYDIGYTLFEALDFIINNHNDGWKAVNYQTSIGSEWDEPFMGIHPERVFTVRKGLIQKSIPNKSKKIIEEIYGYDCYESHCYCYILENF